MADKGQPPELDDVQVITSEPESANSGSDIDNPHKPDSDGVTPHSSQPDQSGSDGPPHRRSTRTLSDKAKYNKALELRITLSKEINRSQTALDTIYASFDQFVNKESLESTLADIEQCFNPVNGVYDELYTICENKVDDTSSKLFHDFVKEIDLLKDTTREKLASLIQAEDEEEEIREMEQTMERLQAELEEQNRIYEERQAARMAIRERALRKPEGSYGPAGFLFQPAERPARLEPTSYHLATSSPQSTNLSTESHDREPPEPAVDEGSTDGLSVVKELSQNLVVAMKASRRSAPTPAVFGGDPIDFQDWELDFDAYVESEGLTGKEPLRYLKKFVKDKAKDAISGHFITNTESAYRVARRELRERFGSKHNVNRALRKRLDEWPRVGAKDSASLRSYADFLSHIKAAMRDVPELHSLNHSQENEKLAAKLPDWMIRNWARKVKEKRSAEYRYPTFSEFVFFVVDQAEVMDEPLMKNIGGNRESSSNSRRPRTTPGSNVRTFATSTTSTATKAESCKYCRKAHLTVECFALARLPFADKETFIKTNRLCYGCLDTGHQSKQCVQRATCKKCNMRHPTALHKEPTEWKERSSAHGQPKEDDKKEDTKLAKNDKVEQEDEPKKLEVKATNASDDMLSMVVPVHVATVQNPSKEFLVYALLDTQSNASYITPETAKVITPIFTVEKVTVETLTGESTEQLKLYDGLKIRGYDQTESTDIKAYEWNKLNCDTKHIPNSINVQKFPHLKAHADNLPPPLDIPIGLLIGRDCPEAFQPLKTISGQKGQPFAQQTMLGWTVLGGKVHSTNGKDEREHLIKVHSTTLNDLNQQTPMSQEDFRFLEILDNNLSVKENGTYEMPLPFRKRPIMPNNRVQALKRLTGLKKKLDTDETFNEEYHAFMDELIARGHAECAAHTPMEGEVWYIPHFAVKHPRKGKIRVVFDCSASFQGTSLNEHLLQGPDLTNNMLGILLRFRKESIALACDVEKMFYNFEVKAEDRNYLRFLWYKRDGTLQEYRMTVHLFGATSSPAVATYGLRALADSQKEVHPAAPQFIRRNFYVDDGITSVDTTKRAVELIKASRSLCKSGNLRLHKFVSNNLEVLEEIPDSERSIKDIDLFEGSLPTQRTLGLEWSIKEDLLKFTAKGFQQKPETRRGVLSTVSQLYDPLGLLAPFSLKGKNILQKINRNNSEWDEEISPELMQPWKEWVKELRHLEMINIPRHMKPDDFGQVKQTELHHFCDASEEGIGACSYIRLIGDNNEIHVSLLLAKSKVVPSKGIITIPRLELQGAVIAAQLSCLLKQELDIQVDKEYFWTDSEIVLAYLANEKKKFLVYVANRVREIKMHTTTDQWHHVNGSDNPADIASRGMDCSKLSASMWFTGPTFLRQVDLEQKLQDKPKVSHIKEDDPEVKKVVQVKLTQVGQLSSLHDRFVKYGSLKKLVTSIAYLKQLARVKSWKTISAPTVADLVDAKNFVISTVQSKYFSAELDALKKGQHISEASDILKFNPFVDKEGILRVGGRTSKATLLDYQEKHPIIIPKSSHLAKLLITDFHEKAHLGRAYTLNAVRQNGYWVIAGARMTKDIVSRCVKCRKLRGNSMEQQMGELPEDRLQQSPPFTMTGIDCFGTFVVKERRTELKRYGLLFTCLYSRAIHIELIDDLTTDAFINALRCFMAIRGAVKRIYCDHGTNFIGGRNEMDKQLHAMTDDTVKRYLIDRQIEFITTTPTASHQGGIWERQIRTVRSVLNQMIPKYQARLDTASLRTALYEVASIVNQRPLSTIHLNNHEEAPLTPNMILTGKPEATPPPPGVFTNEDIYSKARWKKVQALAEEFWSKWKMEYLDTITKRQIWKRARENLKTGDIVMLIESDQPRNCWRMGVVEQVCNGQDGLARKASVKLANKLLDNKGKPMEKATVLQRPVQKLVKLI